MDSLAILDSTIYGMEYKIKIKIKRESSSEERAFWVIRTRMIRHQHAAARLSGKSALTAQCAHRLRGRFFPNAFSSVLSSLPSNRFGYQINLVHQIDQKIIRLYLFKLTKGITQKSPKLIEFQVFVNLKYRFKKNRLIRCLTLFIKQCLARSENRC